MWRHWKLVMLYAAGLAATTASPPAAEPALTVAHGFAPAHVIAAQGVEPWMSCVEERAGDGLSFTYFPAGQIASTTEMLDALENGVADFTTVPIGYVSAKMPLNGVSMLPGLGSTATEVVGAYSRAVRSGLLAEEFLENGIRPVWVMALPAYQIVSASGPLRTQADFAGKVIRSAGGTMNLTISSLGSSSAEIPSSDMYVAMERGTVDATLSALASIKPYNIDEVMDAVSANGEFGSFTVVFSVGEDTWSGLAPEIQRIISDCGNEVEASMATFLDAEMAQLQQEFKAAGVEVYTFTPEELTAIEAKLGPVSSDWVSRLDERGLPATEALTEYHHLLQAQ